MEEAWQRTERQRETDKVGGLILAGETFSPSPCVCSGSFKNISKEERNGKGIWKDKNDEEEHGHSVDGVHCDN